MKKFQTILTAITMAFFILTSSVILTLSMKWTYSLSQNDIHQVEYNLDQKTIKSNYDGLIDYMFQDGQTKLSFKELPMSPQGEIHFKEVKDLFKFAYYGMIFSGLLTLILGYNLYKLKTVEFLKYGSFLVFLIPAILAIPILSNFEKTFITFHELAFSNDYWIFDPAIDPIIRYLPESLFMKNAIIILILIVLMVVLSMLLRKALKKKLDKKDAQAN